MPRIDADRVRLRALAEADLPALFEVFGDAEVMRYWSSPPLADIARAHALLADIRRDRNGEPQDAEYYGLLRREWTPLG